MQNVIPFEYQGHLVHFSTEGWINATNIAKRFGKRPAKWLELPSTKSYMAALAKALGKTDVRKSDFGLVRAQKGGTQQGTWLHPKLAVSFARWLDDDFAVWCDLHIDSLLREELSAQQHYDLAVIALEKQKERGSLAGRELAMHRYRKPPLQQRARFWKEYLQMPLPLQ